METTGRFEEEDCRASHMGDEEEVEAEKRFEVSPVRQTDIGASNPTNKLSDLRDASSSSSSLVENTPVELRQSSSNSVSALETSMSRKEGWLPFPPAKRNTSCSSEGENSHSPRSNLDSDNSQQGRSPDQVSDVESNRSRPSIEPLPRLKSYKIEVKKLYFKLPPPKLTMLSSFRKVLANFATKDNDTVDEIRYILRNISFEAKAGELLGIAGPSGAGKTTILECLAGRVQPTSPPGCILVNDQIMAPSTFRRISAYVMQDDAMFPTLTVHETLLISAKLRLPAKMSLTEKLSRVDSLMEVLGLQDAANTRIGNDMIRGISGGERRRVSIGVDVIHDPAVLILDEPTSGLDSGAALNVVTMLRAMAVSRSRTVVVSIHQPSYRILQLMHSILLVAGGMVVHHGSLELLTSRLATAGHEVPDRTNVLEYAIDAVNSWETEFSIGPTSSVAKGQKLQDLFCSDAVEIDKHLSRLHLNEENRHAKYCMYSNLHDGNRRSRDDDAHFHPNNIVQETAILTDRFFKNILRTKELFTARSLQAIIAGVTLGTVFLNLDSDRKGVSDRLGFFVFTISFLLNSTTEALPIFLQERQILMRETSRGAYRISSYVLSHAVVFVPFFFVIAFFFGGPSYWLTGLNPNPPSFGFYCLVLWLTLLLANSFTAFCGALVPNHIMGQAVVGAFMGAFFLFSGYIINRESIPGYWIWMHYISLFKYPFEALLLNEFGGSHLAKCYEYTDETNIPGCGQILGFCGLNGSQVLTNAGVQTHRKWVDVAAMAGFIIFYRVSCYFAVRWRLQQKIR